MKTANFVKNLGRSLSENRKGIAAVVIAAAVTAILTTASSGSAIVPSSCCSIPVPPVSILPANQGQVRLTTALAQTKFVQGGSGTASIEVSIEAPSVAAAANRKPTDFIVVLDRSGSMSADNRLPYAKSALRELLSRLQEGDRIGLITFDSAVETRIPLSSVNESFKTSARRIIDEISPGGSTNISEALSEASRQLPAVEGGRIRKVLLLSDGEANIGIVNPDGLGLLAHGLTEKSAVLSTIGMGLGFNEQTMSLLADRGMGNYSYLENLEKLGTILARDVDSTRTIYAASSRLDLILPEGARITDAGGYPFAAVDGLRNGFRVETGQLSGGARKSFFVTVELPTGSPGELSFAKAALAYEIDGKNSSSAAEGPLMLAEIVPQARAAESAASINQDLFKRNWTANSLGMMKAKVGAMLRAGKKEDADKAIADYRGQIRDVERQSNVSLMDAPTVQELDKMQADSKDAFTGSAAEQSVKQSRYGKQYHEEGRIWQRSK